MGNLIKTMGKTLVEKTMKKEYTPYSIIIVFIKLTEYLHFLCRDTAVYSNLYCYNTCPVFWISTSNCYEFSMSLNSSQQIRYFFCFSMYVYPEFSPLSTPLHLGIILVPVLLVGQLLACYSMTLAIRHRKLDGLISRSLRYQAYMLAFQLGPALRMVLQSSSPIFYSDRLVWYFWSIVRLYPWYYISLPYKICCNTSLIPLLLSAGIPKVVPL